MSLLQLIDAISGLIAAGCIIYLTRKTVVLYKEIWKLKKVVFLHEEKEEILLSLIDNLVIEKTLFQRERKMYMTSLYGKMKTKKSEK